MSCGQCAGSKASSFLGLPAFVSELFCSQNRAVVYNTFKYAVPGIGAYIGYITNFYGKGYTPFSLSSDTPGYKINVVRSSVKMIGTSDNDLMIAYPEGSKIFAKGGLNYVVAGSGEDELYYSLCSTDVINGKVGVVEGFNPVQDKIKFFCTKKTVLLEDIRIIHDTLDDTDVTYIEVTGGSKISAIALLGDIPIEANDIILNEAWS